jgi:NADH dehydrogenase FAD-containing subunit
MFDVLIIGGGVAGVSTALVLGSAIKKPFVADKKICIFTHQKSSSMQEGIYNNAYGISAGTLGETLLKTSIAQLSELYPHVQQLATEKVLKVNGFYPHFEVITNKQTYFSKQIVVAVGYSNLFNIEGLNQFVEPHRKTLPEKNRVQLKNIDHLVAEGIYVAGTLAGWRSQLSIAAGSGAAVATDILTLWNNGVQTQSHDKR